MIKVLPSLKRSKEILVATPLYYLINVSGAARSVTLTACGFFFPALNCRGSVVRPGVGRDLKQLQEAAARRRGELILRAV